MIDSFNDLFTVNLDERLRLSSCLDDYKLQEVVLVPLGGRNSQSGAVLSVHDLTTMNKKAAAVTVSNSSSSKMSGKSTLRPTSSEATLAGHEKKKRGLFGLLGFGKSKKGSVSPITCLQILFFLRFILYSLRSVRNCLICHHVMTVCELIFSTGFKSRFSIYYSFYYWGRIKL